jgi:hypothetical protein
MFDPNGRDDLTCLSDNGKYNFGHLLLGVSYGANKMKKN